MHSEESFLKDLLALLHTLPTRTFSQGVLLTNSPKSWNLAFLKISALILHLSHFPLEHEFNYNMVTTTQAASNPHVTNQFICIGEQQIPHCIHPDKVYYLT